MLRSMRETIRLNKRAIGIWWRESPGMLVSLFFYVVTGALLPYAGIYFCYLEWKVWQDSFIIILKTVTRWSGMI